MGALLDRACNESLADTGATICDPVVRSSVGKSLVEIARTNDTARERLGEFFVPVSRGLFGGECIPTTGNSFVSSGESALDALLTLCMQIP